MDSTHSSAGHSSSIKGTFYIIDEIKGDETIEFLVLCGAF